MKRALLFIILILTFVTATPVMSYDVPGQSTDNATDVIIWHGDTGNVTITDFETAIDSGAQVIADEMSATVTSVSALVITILTLFGLAAIGYSRGDKWLLMLSGLGFIIYGLSYFDTTWYIAVILIGAGIAIFSRAFTNRGMKT